MAEIIEKTGKSYNIFDKVNNVWNKISFWHKASDCEFNDGKTAQTKLGAIDGITSDLSGESETVAASIKCVNQLNSSLEESLVASDNLKFKFATDGEGNYGYLGADDSFIPFKHEVSADLLFNVDVNLNVSSYGSNNYSGTLKANSTYYYEANFVIGNKNGTWSLTLPSDAKITKLRENIVPNCSYDIFYKIETTNSGSWQQKTSGSVYTSFIFKLSGISNDFI